ncbi:MAG: hypothetical protein ACLR5G_16105 [Eubacteriales bacterium]
MVDIMPANRNCTKLSLNPSHRADPVDDEDMHREAERADENQNISGARLRLPFMQRR